MQRADTTVVDHAAPDCATAGRGPDWAGMTSLCALAICATAALPRAEVDGVVDAAMQELHLPGLSLAVVEHGRVALLRGYGLADVEHRVPVSADTVFEIGSITKQFTAAAVLLLVEEGKVALDDPITKHLQGVPQSWTGITVRHLLNHSSGIQNYLTVSGLPDLTRLTHDQIAAVFFDRLPLEFQPGETWSYSNSGYLLLGNVIEKASGKSYWDFLRERIFLPLGMTATRSSDPAAIIPNRASGYEWSRGRLERRPALTEAAYGAGAVVSTARDMARWDLALRARRLLQRASYDQMWTPLRLAGGAWAPFNYGFGWTIDTWQGRRVIAHSGGTPGCSSVIDRFSEDDLTVIVLTNHGDRVIDQIALDIAGLFRPALARPRVPGADPEPELTATLKRALLDLFAGRHDVARFTPAMRLFLQTGTGKGLWDWLSADGELRSFDFAGEERAGDHRIRRYRAVLGTAHRSFSFLLAPDGTIAQINWW
jgi:CubicO group peptidase (beta-lactamase class C family)